MSTIRDLITGSLRLIEEVGAGETCTAESAQDGLVALNGLIGSWSIQGDMVYTGTVESFSLPAASVSRTIGPTGNFSTTRPTRITAITVEISAGNTVSLQEIDATQYAGIPNKLTQGTPEQYFYDGSYPNATIRFWPVPQTTQPIVIYSEKPLSQYSSINDTLITPPGMERALRFNLAQEVAPEYGKSVSREVRAIAIESKRALQSLNGSKDNGSLRVDDALMTTGIYNIQSDR